MEMKEIDVLLLEPGRTRFELVSVVVDENGSTLDGLQSLVGGLIDYVSMESWGASENLANYDIIVNDEGILLDMLPNVALNPAAFKARNFDEAGILFGPIVIAGHTPDGKTTGVDIFDAMDIVKWFTDKLLTNGIRENMLK